MIPLRDENPSGSTPVVTRALLALNVGLFMYELLLGSDLRRFMMDYAFIPRRLSGALGAGDEPLPGPLFTLVSSLFLHGGWAHLIGNMWYLWIFGDNVEDRLGKARFLIFYLATGVGASLVHYMTQTDSPLPTVGASGAIAGTLGAYLVAFPGARVVTLVPLFPFFQIMALPAALVLGLWFVFQFFSGALALAWSAGSGGVAWWAHIGGFALGMAVMRFWGLGVNRRGARG
jgi:membrane associated rhomboid family serine protease